MAEFDTYGECSYGDGWYKGVRPEIEIPLVATRYILFLPDWRKQVSVEYEQMSSVTESDENKEYRTSLMSRPLITEKVLISHNEFQARIENWLRLRHGTPFYCPLYVEPVEFSGTGSMIGQTVLPAQTDLADYWYLQTHAAFFFVLDRGEEVGEVAEIDSVSDTQVVLKEQISAALTFENAVGFAAFTGLLKGEKMKDITGTLTDFELTLQEIP